MPRLWQAFEEELSMYEFIEEDYPCMTLRERALLEPPNARYASRPSFTRRTYSQLKGHEDDEEDHVAVSTRVVNGSKL